MPLFCWLQGTSLHPLLSPTTAHQTSLPTPSTREAGRPVLDPPPVMGFLALLDLLLGVQGAMEMAMLMGAGGAAMGHRGGKEVLLGPLEEGVRVGVGTAGRVAQGIIQEVHLGHQGEGMGGINLKVSRVGLRVGMVDKGHMGVEGDVSRGCLSCSWGAIILGSGYIEASAGVRRGQGSCTLSAVLGRELVAR